MPIISQIGTRSWKVRLVYTLIYVVLLLGAVTMVYPFLLMLLVIAVKPQGLFSKGGSHGRL